ncbi:MAG: hypothetical protein FJ303_16590 [Planctomycetes bacterium]|nr:hypothetical protein [Planctomycetota bacterium]
MRKFDVDLAGGYVFNVTNPANVLLTKHTLIVTAPEKDIVQWTSPVHIVAIRRRERPLVAAKKGARHESVLRQSTRCQL